MINSRPESSKVHRVPLAHLAQLVCMNSNIYQHKRCMYPLSVYYIYYLSYQKHNREWKKKPPTRKTIAISSAFNHPKIEFIDNSSMTNWKSHVFDISTHKCDLCMLSMSLPFFFSISFEDKPKESCQNLRVYSCQSHDFHMTGHQIRVEMCWKWFRVFWLLLCHFSWKIRMKCSFPMIFVLCL